MTADIITMGCSKNLVDSQQLGKMFRERGVSVRFDPDDVRADVAVVNTCGFIGDAKEESIEMILELCRAKDEGRVKEVCVMGCLSERYRKELAEEIPEVDRYYGKFDWKTLAADIAPTPMPSVQPVQPEKPQEPPVGGAYIKISEGCDRKCAYCAIPLITGRHKSRPMEDILAEVKALVGEGVREFQVIAQELTFYGVDLYGKQRIAELVERMAKIEGVEWIRLHYAYPNQFPLDLLRVIRENANVCNYLDIALQHISDNVLQRMRRHVTRQETLDLLALMRKEVPGLCLRTTLMVGFPGETEEDFNELLDFVREVRFDRMGAFAYSEEEGTYAAQHYADDVPPEVKQARLDKLMRVQQRISAELGQEKVGRRLKTVIDRCEGDYFIGRTEFDSPEVDGEVLIAASEGLSIGSFYNVLITDADEFDLYGTTL
ncbi:MAG: 30S ribosomal protein S12 methylthiotransferase RimO [Alloprevotella sp.]|nr:30S ribosomal protein S12 methylthiotransferase RimO [Alloprevotella sp.]